MSSEKADASSGSHHAGKTGMALIVIADDLPQVRQLLRFTLKSHHTVLEAADGGAALDLARSHPVEVMILDNVMPVLSGVQVCQQVRADPNLRTVGIIITSANVNRIEALEAGADHFLPKPFSPAELLGAVDELLQRGALV
jgi:DNA-binding response OmpR family regulator